MTSPESCVLTVLSGRDEHADSDDLLVKAALAEPKAFGLLYERYYDRVYRYCQSGQSRVREEHVERRASNPTRPTPKSS